MADGDLLKAFKFASLMMALLRPSGRRLASAGGSNLTSLTNLHGRIEQASGGGRQRAIPRMDRFDVVPITLLYEYRGNSAGSASAPVDWDRAAPASSASVENNSLIIFGRRCSNHFGTNQYGLVSMATREAWLIGGAADDFITDWVELCLEMECALSHVLISHCHVDDILNLPILWDMLAAKRGPGNKPYFKTPLAARHWRQRQDTLEFNLLRNNMGQGHSQNRLLVDPFIPFRTYYNPSDGPWLDRFSDVCRYYGRPEVQHATMPLGIPGTLRREPGDPAHRLLGSSTPGGSMITTDAADCELLSNDSNRRDSFLNLAQYAAPRLLTEADIMDGPHAEASRSGALMDADYQDPDGRVKLSQLIEEERRMNRSSHHSYRHRKGTTDRQGTLVGEPGLPPLPLHYIHTPGHSPGHMMFHLSQFKLLFTGDLIFKNSIGRVDLPFARGDAMAMSLRRTILAGAGGDSAAALHGLEHHYRGQRYHAYHGQAAAMPSAATTLSSPYHAMPDDTVLLPGHGPITVLGQERRRSPALAALVGQLRSGREAPRVGNNTGWF